MGWRPDDVRRASLSDFLAAINGHNETHGVGGSMTPAERAALRQEVWGDDE